MECRIVLKCPSKQIQSVLLLFPNFQLAILTILLFFYFNQRFLFCPKALSGQCGFVFPFNIPEQRLTLMVARLFNITRTCSLYQLVSEIFSIIMTGNFWLDTLSLLVFSRQEYISAFQKLHCPRLMNILFVLKMYFHILCSRGRISNG